MLKTLVITSCTGSKQYQPENQLIQADFMDPVSLASRERELAPYLLPASAMYTGMQHLQLMEGINTLREKFGREVVDLYIVSAGYGLIHEDKVIAPYNITFSTMDSGRASNWSKYIKIPQDLADLIPYYHLVFFLLGDKYLKAINLPIETRLEGVSTVNLQKLVFFVSGTSKKLVPRNHPYYAVVAGRSEAVSFSYGLVGLKGHLFKLLANEVVNSSNDLLKHFHHDPSRIMPQLVKYKIK